MVYTWDTTHDTARWATRELAISHDQCINIDEQNCCSTSYSHHRVSPKSMNTSTILWTGKYNTIQLPALITGFHRTKSERPNWRLRRAKRQFWQDAAIVIDGDVMIIIMSSLSWAGCCLFQFTPRCIWIECCHMPVSMNSNAIIFTQQRRLSASLDGLLAVHCPGTADSFEGRFDRSWKKLMK